ncbi:TPA: glycosyltransferase [Vibrio parahaemolyticus]|nr:glycosyltransferase [Vibrio parahaemolyticus]
MKNMLLSIIIPTYKDDIRLDKCIMSIVESKFSGDIEIIVCDNDPEKSCAIQPKQYVFDDKTIDLKVVHEVLPGSYNARNEAAKFATSEVLVFIDSDCYLEGNAIENIASQQVCKGFIFAFNIEMESSDSFFGAYDEFFGIPQKYYVEKLGFSVTAGLAIDKQSFFNLNGFKSNIFSGGDREFCERAIESGFELVFLSDVIVFHPVRSCLSAILSKENRLASGIVDRARKHSAKKIFQINDFFPPISQIKSGFYTGRKVPIYKVIIAISLSYPIKLYRQFCKLKHSISSKRIIVRS